MCISHGELAISWDLASMVGIDNSLSMTGSGMNQRIHIPSPPTGELMRNLLVFILPLYSINPDPIQMESTSRQMFS